MIISLVINIFFFTFSQPSDEFLRVFCKFIDRDSACIVGLWYTAAISHPHSLRNKYRNRRTDKNLQAILQLDVEEHSL
jgi:hypothetical protein